MEYCLDVSFKKQERFTFAYVIGAIYCQALINIGFSADTHLNDLPLDRISKGKRDASTDFILNVSKVYDSLPDEEKDIFLVEFLEKGRHYNFWFLSFYGYKSFKCLRNKTFKDIHQLIKKGEYLA